MIYVPGQSEMLDADMYIKGVKFDKIMKYGDIGPHCTNYQFVKIEALHIATARIPLFHQNQPLAQYLHRN